MHFADYTHLSYASEKVISMESEVNYVLNYKLNGNRFFVNTGKPQLACFCPKAVTITKINVITTRCKLW